MTFTKGRGLLVSICESWRGRAHWEPGKHTCALTIRFLQGPTQRLLPAACSTCSKQERYRNETQGKWNGNNDKEHNEAQNKTVCLYIRKRNIHTKMKKTKWNRRKIANLLHQDSHPKNCKWISLVGGGRWHTYSRVCAMPVLWNWSSYH